MKKAAYAALNYILGNFMHSSFSCTQPLTLGCLQPNRILKNQRLHDCQQITLLGAFQLEFHCCFAAYTKCLGQDFSVKTRKDIIHVEPH
ncbi:hypothetical protein XJ20_18120 [Serratia liquefaciens]|nr:hypothetical protein XJ20_18120 [Serratia liquefaciens]